MKAYHGTSKNVEKLDATKTKEFGLYFTTNKNVALAYGENLHEVELSFDNLIDLSLKPGVKRAVDIFPIAAQVIIDEGDLDNLTTSELIEDEFETCLSILSDSSVNISSGRCLRDELLKSLSEAGYDAVKIEDYIDGDYHDAYIIFDNKKFKVVK